MGVIYWEDKGALINEQSNIFRKLREQKDFAVEWAKFNLNVSKQRSGLEKLERYDGMKTQSIEISLIKVKFRRNFRGNK